jgi:hypothetical protein
MKESKRVEFTGVDAYRTRQDSIIQDDNKDKSPKRSFGSRRQKMKAKIQKLLAVIMVLTLATAAAAALKEKRIRLKNGKGSETTTLNPSRTYRFVIAGAEFQQLSIDLRSKGGKIQVEIKSPTGETISSGTGKRFSIKKIEQGDYQIILKNIGNSSATVGMKLGDIKGEAR